MDAFVFPVAVEAYAIDALHDARKCSEATALGAEVVLGGIQELLLEVQQDLAGSCSELTLDILIVGRG